MTRQAVAPTVKPSVNREEIHMVVRSVCVQALPALAAGLLAASAAEATVNYSAHSATGWQSLYQVTDSESGFERSVQFCDFGGVCYDSTARAGQDGLFLRQTLDFAAPGNGVFGLIGSSVSAVGTMALQTTSGGASWVDGLMTLRLHGSNLAQLDQTSFDAEILARLRLTAFIGDRRFAFTESDQVNSSWPATYSDRMWRSGADTVSAWVTLPVGSFAFALVLEADGVGRSYGSVGFFGVTGYEAGFFADRPLFELPAGYSVSSTDFGIINNQWCQGPCAPVPEPATWLLLPLGLLGLAWRRRTREKARDVMQTAR